MFIIIFYLWLFYVLCIGWKNSSRFQTEWRFAQFFAHLSGSRDANLCMYVSWKDRVEGTGNIQTKMYAGCSTIFIILRKLSIFFVTFHNESFWSEFLNFCECEFWIFTEWCQTVSKSESFKLAILEKMHFLGEYSSSSSAFQSVSFMSRGQSVACSGLCWSDHRRHFQCRIAERNHQDAYDLFRIQMFASAIPSTWAHSGGFLPLYHARTPVSNKCMYHTQRLPFCWNIIFERVLYCFIASESKENSS